MSENFESIDADKESELYNAFYRTYLRGYSDATSDSVDQLKLRMQEFGEFSYVNKG
jgi:hypothetical protein